MAAGSGWRLVGGRLVGIWQTETVQEEDGSARRLNIDDVRLHVLVKADGPCFSEKLHRVETKPV